MGGQSSGRGGLVDRVGAEAPETQAPCRYANAWYALDVIWDACGVWGVKWVLLAVFVNEAGWEQSIIDVKQRQNHHSPCITANPRRNGFCL
jgi:hypothetical protein